MRNPLLLVCLLASSFAQAEVVNVYSARSEALIKPLFERFTEQSGIDVKVLSSKANALMERLKAEGQQTPADVLLTVDAGNLVAAKRAELLQPYDVAQVDEIVPEHLRDAEGHWAALSQRARVIVASERLDESDLPTRYQDLADSKYQGRVCMRSSSNIYNQSLLASFIANDGAEAAQAWAKGVVDNFARPPSGNDRGQIKDIAADICDLSIVNTYYLGIMLSDPEQRPAAQSIRVIFPNQADRGTHVNVSGAGITRHAKHKDAAQKLMAFLVDEQAQQWYADSNHEYPVRKDVMPSELVRSFGSPFKADTLPVAALGEQNSEAVKIFDIAGWR